MTVPFVPPPATRPTIAPRIAPATTFFLSADLVSTRFLSTGPVATISAVTGRVLSFAVIDFTRKVIVDESGVPPAATVATSMTTAEPAGKTAPFVAVTASAV